MFYNYLQRHWLFNTRNDILSGLVVALALIPEAIAFSIIAGVDPKVGLYASFAIATISAFAGGRPAMISAATGAMAALRQRQEQGGFWEVHAALTRSAMEMMAVDPVERVLAPRFWGGVLTMPVLSAVFCTMGVLGGWLVGVVMIGVDNGAFWSQIQQSVDVWVDVGNSLLKSLVFGVAVTFIALLQGYVANPTPEGVSRATTRTVVMSSLTVLALDILLTAVMFIS